jgi:hypothetical protein
MYGMEPCTAYQALADGRSLADTMQTGRITPAQVFGYYADTTTAVDSPNREQLPRIMLQ